jgi:hypothetical protein
MQEEPSEWKTVSKQRAAKNKKDVSVQSDVKLVNKKSPEWQTHDHISFGREIRYNIFSINCDHGFLKRFFPNGNDFSESLFGKYVSNISPGKKAEDHSTFRGPTNINYLIDKELIPKKFVDSPKIQALKEIPEKGLEVTITKTNINGLEEYNLCFCFPISIINIRSERSKRIYLNFHIYPTESHINNIAALDEILKPHFEQFFKTILYNDDVSFKKCVVEVKEEILASSKTKPTASKTHNKVGNIARNSDLFSSSIASTTKQKTITHFQNHSKSISSTVMPNFKNESVISMLSASNSNASNRSFSEKRAFYENKFSLPEKELASSYNESLSNNYHIPVTTPIPPEMSLPLKPKPDPKLSGNSNTFLPSPLQKVTRNPEISNKNDPNEIIEVLLKLLLEQTTVYSYKQKEVKQLSENLRQEAQRFGSRCHNVPGDGNCFFEAVIHQFQALQVREYNQINHMYLRRIAVEHIAQHQSDYQNFIEGDFDNFITRMNKGGTWANNVIITALAQALNINVIIINSDGSAPIIISGRTPRYTIHLGYEVERHYQSLIVDNPGTFKLELRRRIDPSSFATIYPKETESTRQCASVNSTPNATMFQSSSGTTHQTMVTQEKFTPNQIKEIEDYASRIPKK